MRRSDIAGLVVAVIAVPGGLGYLYHRAATAPHAMEVDELQRIARQLASDGRESARLAGLVAAGQVNAYYARAQHEKISEDVRDGLKSLDAPPPQGREDDTRRAAALASDMKARLDQTAPQLADAAAMRKLQSEHARIAADLEAIAAR